MNIEEQKELLIHKIKIEKDEQVLNTVYHLLERDFAVSEVERFFLTPAQKKGVEEGLADIKAGRTYNNEEANQMMNDLLND